jgi:hypothetical protein
MYIRNRWLTRGMVAVAGTAAVSAGLVLSGIGAPAASAAAAPRITGGVEDGTFAPTCLHGHSVTPDTGVLSATTYRNRLGTVVRILVPYNIATKRTSDEFKCFNSYLSDAGTYGAAVEVSLVRLHPGAKAPSLGTYTKAVGALAKVAGAAKKAGQYLVAANKVFPGKIVAGDFASGVSPSFLSSYIKAIGNVHPATWAIHPYTDVTNFQYYVHAGLKPLKAGAKAAARSKVLQLAENLHKYGYGSTTSIWINEIYVDHTADKNPPAGTPGKKGSTTFSIKNQAEAALFLRGGLGPDSLPGVLAGKDLPQLTQFIYLRAWDASTDQQQTEADVLEVQFPDCLYYTLAGHKSTPAPQCS